MSGGGPTNERHTRDVCNVSSTVFRGSVRGIFMKINSDLANCNIYICYWKEMVIITAQIVMYPLPVTKTILKIIRGEQIANTST